MKADAKNQAQLTELSALRQRVAELEAAEAERRQVERAIRLMSEAQRQIAHLESAMEIYTLVGKSIQELIEDGYVIITRLDDQVQGMRLVALFGLGSLYERLIRMFRVDPTKSAYSLQDMTPEELELFRSGRLERFEGGIYSLMVRKAPKAICDLVEKELGFTGIYTMGFVWQGRHYGGVVILAKRDIAPYRPMIETIVNQASVSIQRLQSEEALKASEKRFRDIADNAHEWIWEVDAQGKYTYASQTVEKILGYTPEETLQKSFYDLLHPEDREAFKAAAFAAFAAKQPFRGFINRNVHKNGETVWLDTSGLPLLDDKGNLLGYRGADADITERKRAEEALRESEEKYRLLVEYADEAIVLFQGGRLVFVNPKATVMTGYSPEELAASPFAEFVHPEDRERVVADHLKILSGESVPEVYAFRIVRKDGAIRWLEVNAVLISWLGAPAVLSFLADVTERKRTEEALLRREQDLRAFSEMGMSLAQTLDLREVYRTARDHVARMVEAPNFAISLYDQAARTLRAEFVISDGIALDTTAIPPLKMSDPPVLRGRAKALIMAQPEVMDEMPSLQPGASGSLHIDASGLGLKPLSAVYVPMVVKGQVVGLLEAQSYRARAYGEGEVALLGPVANQIGLAMENARLFQQVRERVSELEQSLRDLTEAQMALRESESSFRLLVESAPEAVFVHTEQRFAYLNPAAVTLFGATVPEELLGQLVADRFHPDYAAAGQERMRLLTEDRQAIPVIEAKYLRLDGKVVDVEVSAVPFVYQGADGALAFVRDITEHKRLEAQFLQAQKMEIVGRLAGGVAHDFNNLLTAISGNAEFALEDLPAEHPARSDIQEIAKAADRAASLTRQLLAFSRRQIIELHVVSLNDLVLNLDRMLRRLIGEDIELVTLPAADLGLTKADPGQIEQSLVNLVINARDAMPNGGKLTIETANFAIDEAFAQDYPGAVPGEYVMLVVSDTGAGMTAEVKAHLFEPFFTTKGVGKGTGLGLAMVFGIVKQHGGHIYVDSAVGHGTTIKIYLQRVDEPTGNPPQFDHIGQTPRGHETVLVVEDEPVVRGMAVRLLKELGYVILQASNGQEGLRVAAEHAGPIHLLLTDVVMPQMGGKELAERITAMRPGIGVLYMSGYAEDAIAHQGELDGDVAFLPKPFQIAVLGRKVREVLDR
jgi:PAS domain S-box-containing protein